MDQNQKVMLKVQLVSIRGVLSASQGTVATAKALANVPVVTPMGPVPVPALPAIATALDLQNQTADRILKFLDSMITSL